MRKMRIAGTVVLAAFAAWGAAALGQEIEVTPGYTDGFFDGADHQVTGIDVYIDVPDWGAIPMPGEPVPAEEYSTKSFRGAPTAVAHPDGRRLAVVYRDGPAQFVALDRPFRDVERLTVVGEADEAEVGAALAALAGRWRTGEWGTATLRVENGRLVGRASRRNTRIEADPAGPLAFEGTWSNDDGRSGRIVLFASADGTTLRGRWWRGWTGPGGTLSGRRGVGEGT